MRLTLDYKIEFLRRYAQRAAGVTGEVSPLASVFAGLEPERPAEPKAADTRDVWAAIPVDGREPAGVTIGPASPRHLGHAARETAFDARPFEQGRSIQVVEIDYVHSQY